MRLNQELDEDAVHIRDFAQAVLPDLEEIHIDIRIRVLERKGELEGAREVVRFVEYGMVDCSLSLLTVAHWMGYSPRTAPRRCR